MVRVIHGDTFDRIVRRGEYIWPQCSLPKPPPDSEPREDPDDDPDDEPDDEPANPKPKLPMEGETV